MNLRRDFDMDEVLALSSEQVNELKRRGAVITEHATAKEYSIGDDNTVERLVYDQSLSSYYFEFEPAVDIDLFVHHAYFVNLYPKTGKVSLKAGYEKPLSELLIDKMGTVANIPVLSKNNLENEQTFFTDVLVTGAVGLLKSTGSFKGQIACCSCGIGGCSSEYLWAENSVGLISFGILAAGLCKVSVFPFRIGE